MICSETRGEGDDHLRAWTCELATRRTDGRTDAAPAGERAHAREGPALRKDSDSHIMHGRPRPFPLSQ